MAEKDQASKAAVVVSVGAAITAAYALLKRTKAAPGGVLQLPEELWNLIIAIASSVDSVDTDLDQVISAINSLALTAGQGWPSNTDSIQTFRVICVAANTAYPLPDMAIPDGFSLVVAAWPLNANLIFISDTPSGATNPNSIDALAAGGLRTLSVQNAKCIWVSAVAAGDSVTLLSEKRRVR